MKMNIDWIYTKVYPMHKALVNAEPRESYCTQLYHALQEALFVTQPMTFMSHGSNWIYNNRNSMPTRLPPGLITIIITIKCLFQVSTFWDEFPLSTIRIRMRYSKWSTRRTTICFMFIFSLSSFRGKYTDFLLSCYFIIHINVAGWFWMRLFL